MILPGGDNRWRELLETFYARVREVLQLYRGREISTAGDGFLAAFDGPARATRTRRRVRRADRDSHALFKPIELSRTLR